MQYASLRTYPMNARVDSLESASAVSPDASIGSIAVQLPGATAVFRRLKLDFCCGGNVALAQAVADKGLALDSVLAELRPCNSQPLPEAATPANWLIVTRFHDVHRQQLPS